MIVKSQKVKLCLVSEKLYGLENCCHACKFDIFEKTLEKEENWKGECFADGKVLCLLMGEFLISLFSTCKWVIVIA